MIIDKKTGALTELSQVDIGNKVEGVIIRCGHILFQQPGSTFQAFVTDAGISCSLKSPLQISAGISYKVSGTIGQYRDKPQLTICSIELVQDDESGFAVYSRFLSGAFEDIGITPKIADKIAKVCKDNLIEELMNSPQDVALSVRGLSEDTAVKAGEKLVLNKDGYIRLLNLMKAGLSYRQAQECDRRTDISPDDISDNPFCLAVIDSFSFEDCESIAGGKKIDPLNKFRVFSCIRTVLDRAHQNTSSTYFDVAEVENAVFKMIIPKDSGRSIVSAFPAAFELACEYGSKTGFISIYRFDNNKCSGCSVRDKDARIASSVYFKAEAQIKREIEHFVKAKFKKPDDSILNDTVYSLAAKFDISLDDDQAEALRMSMYQPVSIITGGPGVGKTTIMGLLAAYFDMKNIKCAFAAPTGRAAKRLSDATGSEAFTVHRLLEACADPVSPSGFFFRRGKDNPIDARVIVVDEMSMVDTLLFRDFLFAVGRGTSIVLIGDPDQLPSVGCGNVLSDLISCRSIPRVHLKTIHRHEDGGSIATNAARILTGEPLEESSDFKIIQCDKDQAAALVCDLYREKVTEESSDVIVLSPTKQPQLLLSTVNINNHLQMDSHTVEELSGLTSSGIGRYLIGDRIMQTKNNYSLEYYDPQNMCTGEGVFNGEFGTVTDIDEGSMTVNTEFEDGKRVSYRHTDMNNIELAYAITVHKAQGCEFDECILVLGKMNKLLYRRNILYTAITRGKKSITIIDTDNTLASFLKAPADNSRKTSLKDLFAIIDYKQNGNEDNK